MSKISQIVGPPAPSYPCYSGKGLQFGDGTSIMIFGYPIPNYLSNAVSGRDAPWTVLDQTTLFDVSSISEDHEVIVVLFDVTIPLGTSTLVKWYRARDNQNVFTLDKVADADFIGYAAWIGWLSEQISAYLGAEEIQENGNYYVVFDTNIGHHYTINFAVKGIPAYTRLGNATRTSFDWKVNLSNTFDTNSYIRVGLCASPFTNGQSSPPNNIVASVNAPTTPSTDCIVEGSFTGQTPGQTYTLYGFAQAANGLYYECGVDSITLPNIPDPPSAPISLVSRIEGGLNVAWGPATGATSYTLTYVWGDWWDFGTISGILTTSYSLTNLIYGHQYAFYILGRNPFGESSLVGPSYIVTAPKTPTISGQATNNSITVSIGSSMEGGWDAVRVWRYTTGGALIDYKDIPSGSTQVSWTGLAQGSTYKFKAQSYLGSLWSVSQSNEITVTAVSRPALFSWDTPKVAGQHPAILTPVEWNRLLQNIRDVYAWKGWSLASYPLTNVSSGTTFLASYFNQAKNAIGSKNATGIADKKRGDPILAADLNTLVTKLNQIT